MKLRYDVELAWLSKWQRQHDDEVARNDVATVETSDVGLLLIWLHELCGDR